MKKIFSNRHAVRALFGGTSLVVGLALTSCSGDIIQIMSLDKLENANDKIIIEELDSVQDDTELLFDETIAREELKASGNTVNPGPDEILFDTTLERELAKQEALNLAEAKNKAIDDISNYVSPNSPYPGGLSTNYFYPDSTEEGKYNDLLFETKENINKADDISKIDDYVINFKAGVDNITISSVEKYNMMHERLQNNREKYEQMAYTFEGFDNSIIDEYDYRVYFGEDYYVLFTDQISTINYLNGDKIFIIEDDNKYNEFVNQRGYEVIDGEACYIYTPNSYELASFLYGSIIDTKKYDSDLDNLNYMEKFKQLAEKQGRVYDYGDVLNNGCNGDTLAKK